MAPLNLSDVSFSLSVDNARAEQVTTSLVAFNKTHTAALPLDSESPPPAAPLEVYALDSEGIVIGGLIGRTHSIRDWYEISVIWVEETFRVRGMGRQFMELAEQEAIRRGCRYARLATSDFQAPGFYEKLGYILYGKLANCPPGVTCFYYWKELKAA